MVDYSQIPSPCYVMEEEKLERNLKTLRNVKDKTGIEIILAFKGFAMWSTFPLIKKYVKGAAASSLNEALLCDKEMGCKAHTYAVAYQDNQFDEIVNLSKLLTFNSLSQFEKFKNRVPGDVGIGLRVNPEFSDVKADLYNPASPQSRLGMTSDEIGKSIPDKIEGLHFHVLCESSAESLKEVLRHFEKRF